MSTWFGRGVGTVLDQALFAGSNFLLNIWLARTLSPVEYGIYTMVGYAGFLLASAVHKGYLTEPQLVFGAGRFKASARAYLSTLLVGHCVFSAGIAGGYAVAGGVALVLGQEALGVACFVMAGTQAAILVMWIMRRACYTQFRPFVAVTGGALYLVVVAVGLTAAEVLAGGLTVAFALALIGGASLAAAGWIYVRLGLSDAEPPAPGFRAEVRRRHAGYGHWAAPTGLMEMGYGLLPFLLLPIWSGLGAAGTLRALYNLILPVAHVNAALSDLLLPSFVQARAAGRLWRTVTLALGGLLGMACVYWLLLIVAGADLMHLLYAGQYMEHAPLLGLLGAVPVIGAVMVVMLALLRSMERPRAVFVARTAAAGVALTVGTYLIYRFTVAGAIVSIQLALAAETALMLALTWSLWGGRHPGAQPTGAGSRRDGEGG